nr:DUF748 domain-containing protein [Desulfobulbaceae bacterium]
MQNKQSFFQRLKMLSRPKKIALSVLTGFTLYALVGFLILPPIIKLTLEKKLPPILHRDVSVNKIRLNPLTLSATIEGFQVLKKEATGPLVSFEKLHIDLQAVSVFKGALIIKSVMLKTPTINFSRINDSTYSFSDLIPKNSEETAATKPASPFLFSVNNIEIIGGDISFSDQPKEKTHQISQLNLALASISNLPYHIETFIQPTFSANVNGTPFALDGVTKPFATSRESDINIDIKNLNIAEYVAYLPNPTKAVLSSCLLDINGNLDFTSTQNNSATNTLSYTGEIVFKEIAITDQEGKRYIELPRITITTAASNLLDLKVHISKLEIEAPKFIVKRTKDQQILPLTILLPDANESTPHPPEENKGVEISGEPDHSNPFNLAIDTISLVNGQLTYTDETVDSFETILQPFNVQVKNFNTAQGKTASYDLSVSTETSETITSTGTVQLNPLAANGNVRVSKVSLPKYMPYANALLRPEITSGSLDFSTDFSVSISQDNSPKLLLENSTVLLENFKLLDKGKPVIDLAELALVGGQIDLAKKTMHLESFTSKKALFTVIRDQNSLLNVNSFVIEPTASEKQESTKPLAPDTSEQSQAPWAISLGSANFSDHELIFLDQSLAKPSTLRAHNISIKLAGFSTTGPPGSIDFSTELNSAGSIKARGKVGISPVSAELETEVNQVGFKPFQAYVDELFNVLITDGSLSSSGTLTLHSDSENPVLNFTGTGAIDNFASIDTKFREDLARWNKISLSLAFISDPFRLVIDDVQWDEPYAKIVISDQGTINLSELTKKPPSTPPSQVPASQDQADQPAAKDITIKKFTVDKGQFDFIDNKIKPAYASSLSDFSGTVTGLSSKVATQADVKFEGKLNQFSPILISGSINPLAKDLFADLKIDFHDIDLSPTSPYTGKHLGYKTDKGKLTLNLHYIVQGREILAKNHLFLDQFTLGETVESPDAVSLPIHLALALLKNRSGEIILNIPVQGNLDDPQFSIASVVVKVLFNLITKAVTSPFALLGALIPDGEDLQLVPFKPGLASISDEHSNNLTQIASVLYERPGLRMDIVGKVDPQKDGQAIEELRFQKMIKLQKAKDQQKNAFSKDALPDIEDIVVSEEEYPQYLFMA